MMKQFFIAFGVLGLYIVLFFAVNFIVGDVLWDETDTGVMLGVLNGALSAGLWSWALERDK